MSIYRRAPKRDKNEPEIIQALRQCGAMVTQLSGENVPDLLVIYQGQVVLIEVKSAKGKLQDGQSKWITTASEHGVTAHVIRTVDEARRAIGAI